MRAARRPHLPALETTEVDVAMDAAFDAGDTADAAGRLGPGGGEALVCDVLQQAQRREVYEPRASVCDVLGHHPPRVGEVLASCSKLRCHTLEGFTQGHRCAHVLGLGHGLAVAIGVQLQPHRE